MNYTSEELLAVAMSREIEDNQTVAVGTLSPIPAAAALLAQLTHAPHAEVIMLGSKSWWPFTGGSNEFFDYCQRGKVDIFFLSGAQIDQKGNLNLVNIGDHEQPKVRFPGGAGSSMMSFMAGKTIVFKTDHSKRSMVPEVDFVASPGFTSSEFHRAGRAEKVITSLASFDYDLVTERLKVASIHPDVSKEKLQEETGFPLLGLEDVAETAAPDAQTLHLLRTEVSEKLTEVYPVFASKLAAAN